MKRLLQAAAVAVTIAAGGVITPATAQAETHVSVSFDYFHRELSPHGQWFSHPRYGWSWQPHGVAAGWRPYTHGRWVWTDDHGWMWASYYDWGWAAFHYGRWAFDDEYGWYWVPGYTWGPAWVAWRSGDGFIGWYALPPEATWSPTAGIAYHGAGIYGYRYSPYWVFVPEHHFASTRIHTVIVRAGDNHRFFRNTHRKTRYRRVRSKVFNYGLDRRYVARVTGRRIAAVKPRVTHERGKWRRHGPGRRDVRILRPRVVERGHRASTRQQRRVARPRAGAPKARVRPNAGRRVEPRAEPRVERRSTPRVQRKVRRPAAPQSRTRRQNRHAQPRVRPRLQQRAQPRVRQRVQPRAQQRVHGSAPQVRRRGYRPTRPQVQRRAQPARQHRARRQNQARRHRAQTPPRAARRANRPAPRQRIRQARQPRRRAQPQESHNSRNRGGAPRGRGSRRRR